MAHDGNIDESWLIERIREGEEFAFESVFKCYYTRLYLYALKYVKDSQTAEGVVLRVLERLWEKREQISIDQSLSSYLFQSVYHESLDHLKSFSHRQKPTEHQYLEDNSTPDDNFLAQFYADELEGRIKQGIKQLPAKCRDIFYMSRYKGLSHKEIAEKLNISFHTVKHQIGIALEKLREMLDAEE
ncbi:MAG: RNA polymerase sigma-70 factor [Bacteroidales bacterium]